MQNLFTTPDVVYHKVAGILKEYDVSKSEIEELCYECEINYIKDADMLRRFVDAELTVDKETKLAMLPCNVSRILNVYVGDDPVDYVLVGNFIKVNDDYDKVYLSYIGINVNEKGEPVIRTEHIPALTTFCIKSYLEPDVIIGKKPRWMYQDYDLKFSNQVIALKQSFGHKDAEFHNKIEAIKFNFLPVVAQNRLLHKIFD